MTPLFKQKRFYPVAIALAIWGPFLTYQLVQEVNENVFQEKPAERADLLTIQERAEPTAEKLVALDRKSGSIMYGGQLSHIQTDKPGTFYAALALQAVDALEVQAAPVDVSIVLDVSGSMNDSNKLNNALQAARTLVVGLDSTDRVSLVTYSDYASLEVPPAAATQEHKATIFAELNSIYAAGGTNIGEGFTTAGLAMSGSSDEFVRRVILISDGNPSVGVVDPVKLAQSAGALRESKNLTISTIGLGLDYNARLMEEIANQGGGSYYFVGNSNEISDVMTKELGSMKKTLANNVRVRITTPEFISIKSSVGGAITKYSSREGEIYVGDFPAGNHRSAFVELEVLNPKALIENGAVLKVEVTHSEGTKYLTQSMDLTMGYGSEMVEEPVLTRLKQIETSESVRTAMELFDSYQKEQAAQTLERQQAINVEFLKRYGIESAAFDRVNKDLLRTAEKLRVIEAKSYEGKWLIKEKFNYANGSIQSEVNF